MPFTATCRDLEIVLLSEVSQKEKDKYHRIALTHELSNMTQMNLSIRNRLTGIENRLVVAKGEERGGGMGWDLGISRCELLYREWIHTGN